MTFDDVIAKQGDHSIFAPSASKMWMSCPGSLIPNILAGDSAGYEAAEGTVAHGVAETWLRSGERPDHLVGTFELVHEAEESFEIPIDAEMLNQVERYVSWCQYLPGDHHVEVRVDLSMLMPIPNQGGTADHVICNPGRLIVTDLKYGIGVQVFAERNPQLMLYALGAFYRWDAEYDFDEVEIRVGQPRLDHFDVWVVSRDDLLEFADLVKSRARKAWDFDAERVPTEEGCQWCRVKSTCGALLAYMADLVEGVFDDLDAAVPVDRVDEMKTWLHDEEVPFTMTPVNPHNLTTADLAKVYPFRKMVENFLKAIEDELERRAHNGEHIPGYKLVEGRTRRAFSRSDEDVIDTVELMFGLDPDEMFEKKMLSPSKLEEYLRKNKGYKAAELQTMMPLLVYKPVGSPTLAPLSDKRPSLSQVIDDSFDNLDDETREDDL